MLLPVSLSCSPSKNRLLKPIQTQGLKDGLAKQSTLAADVVWQLVCDTNQSCFPHLCCCCAAARVGCSNPGPCFLLYTHICTWCSALLHLSNTKPSVLHNKKCHFHCFVSSEDNPCSWVQSPHRAARPMYSCSSTACMFQVLIFWLQEELCVS